MLNICLNFCQFQRGVAYKSVAYEKKCVAPDLLKALAILSDTTVRRSAVDREDLKPYQKSEKKVKFLWVINNPIIYKFFKDFTNHRKKTNRAVVFVDLYPTFLDTRTSDETFQLSVKKTPSDTY